MSFPKTYAAKSGIHGRGLFAGEKIQKGTVIGQCEVTATKKNGAYVLWIDDGNDGYRVHNSMKFINHAEKPNAVYYDDFSVVALKTIKKDEEITHYYGEGWDE